MAQKRSRITNRQVVAFVILSVLFSYAIPTIFGMKSPRLTPHDALSALELKEREARALRSEITVLEERVALLLARNTLAEKAQALALEKSQDAQTAFDEAEVAALVANEAFEAADLKELEAKQALRYARMTEQQARDALQSASEKEKTAQTALSTATNLQQEAQMALTNAQTQSRLASQTLAEIKALEAKIAELNSELIDEAKQQSAPAVTDNTTTIRRLPNPGSAVVVFDDRLVRRHNEVSIPKDLSSLDVRARKERFISLLLPLIIEANDTLSARRQGVLTAIETDDQAVINRMATLYGLRNFKGDETELHSTLLRRIAPVPASLALAQAAVESGWGQSRFAKEGNALFGQWAWSADAGIKPLDASNSRAVIRSFATIYDSVFAYMHNLNTHYAYEDFRAARAATMAKSERPSGLKLARYLTAYAELGQKYVYTLQAMILSNRFDIYETYELAQ